MLLESVLEPTIEGVDDGGPIGRSSLVVEPPEEGMLGNGSHESGVSLGEGPGESSKTLVLRLGYRPPYDFAAMLDFLRGRALPGVESVDDTTLKSALVQDVLGEEKFAQSLTLDDMRYLLAD